MDTHAPTISERVVEEGGLAPAPTPVQSEVSSTRSPRHFAASPSSPLHASSRASSSKRPVGGDSGHSTADEEDEERGRIGRSSGESSVPPTQGKKASKRTRILRRPYGLSSKRSLKRSSGSGKSQEGSGKSWVAMMRKSRYNPSIVLKNTGAVARDHLASERTFLAYVRTSMGLASMGVALVQLFAIADITSRALGTNIPTATPNMQRFARPLGALTIALAFAVLIIGVYRYFKIQFTLPSGDFPIARISAVFTSFVFAAIVVTIFGAVLSGRVAT